MATVTASSEQTTPSYIESVSQSNKAGKSIFYLVYKAKSDAAETMGGGGGGARKRKIK